MSKTPPEVTLLPKFQHLYIRQVQTQIICLIIQNEHFYNIFSSFSSSKWGLIRSTRAPFLHPTLLNELNRKLFCSFLTVKTPLVSSYQAFCESFSVPHHPCRWGTCSVFLATDWEVCLCIVSDPVKSWPTKMWSDYKQIRPIKIQIINENVTFVFWIFCLSGWNLMAQLKFISQQ